MARKRATKLRCQCGRYLTFKNMEDGAEYYFEPEPGQPEVQQWLCPKCIKDRL